MNPTVQVSCDIQVELSRFYNVDLFHRGYYQVRVSVDTKNRDRRIQLSLDRSAEQNSTEEESERRSTRNRRVQCPILPPCISADGQTGVSKTFLILYKQDCMSLNDVFKFRLDVLHGADSIEEQFVKAGVTLKVDLWYADEDEPSDEGTLRGAMQSVAQRTLRINMDLRNGLHSYMPCTFDYYHLGTVCINVHATLVALQLPTFRPTPANGEAASNGSATQNGELDAISLQSVLFDPVLSANSAEVNHPASDSERRDRHLRASERYNEACTLLLGAQESLRRQLTELRRLVPNALDVRISSAGLAARLEAMCEAVQVSIEENDLVDMVTGDFSLLAAEIGVLWTHYLAIVTLNPLVTQHYAVRYQQQRVRRLAEGFLTIEYRKQQLLDPHRASVAHDELANMIRSSSYFQSMLPMPLECAETDGTPSSMPIVFEEVFIDDEANSNVVLKLSDSQPNPTPVATSRTAFLSNSLQLPTNDSSQKRELSTETTGPIRMIRSASASKTSLQSDVNSCSKSSFNDALSDTEAEARGDERADLIRIAHATNRRKKDQDIVVVDNGSGSGSSSPDEDALTVASSISNENGSPSSKSNGDSQTRLTPQTQTQTQQEQTVLTKSKRRSSNDMLGIFEMLNVATAPRNVTAADILASRSKDRNRVDYLLEFEQRAQLANANQSVTLASQQPMGLLEASNGDGSNRPTAQKSIVATVPDRLVRFIRHKEDFKRRLSQLYNGHLCSDQAFAAATCPFYWAPPVSSKLLVPQPPTDPGLHLVVCVHGMDGFAHDLRSARVALEQALPATRFDFLLSKRNQRETSHEFDVLGERLVSEILQHIDARGAMPARISFVGFSLGNVIIRTALASPGLRHLLPKLHTFLSLAGPHLGVLYQTSTLVGVGTWLVRKWKKSESLMQLCLKDHADLRQTFIYRLSRCASLALFRHVLLVSSPQDHYVPRHSARLELAANIVRDTSDLGRVYVEMLANLLSPLAASTSTQLVRFDVVFALPNDTNAFIGRAAHCAVMENELFLEKFFTVSAAKYFR